MIREAPAPPPLAKEHDPSRPAGPKEPELDVTNIQGNILAGFNKDYQTLLFVRITNATAARTWLGRLLPYIATTSEVLAFNRLFKEIRRRRNVESRTVQATWVNVALSFNGLRAIEKAGQDLAKDAGRFRAFQSAPKDAFSVDLFKDEAFREGLTSRAVGKLNDPSSGEGEPSNWVFGGPGNEADMVVIVASDDRDDLDDEVARVENTIYSGRTVEGSAASGVTIIYKQRGATLPAPLTGHEHFGFLDGVSQPGIRGRVSADPHDVLTLRQNPDDEDQGKPGQDLLWPGEFVFGYPGQIEDSKVDLTAPGPDSLGKGKDAVGPVWARDGSYLVVRRLRQDVPLFHKFLEDTAKQIGTTADLLGAKLVGRWKSGAPVMRAPSADNTKLAFDDCANNHFEFHEESDLINPPAALQACQTESPLCTDNIHPKSPGDKTGDVCPFAAHIRKTYPRDDTGTLAEQIGETTTQTHRLLRRGIPYGAPFFEPKDPDRQRDEGDRGLVFAAYQTSIINQFEFVQSAWANNPDFKDKAVGGELVSGFDLIIGQAGGDRKRSCPVRLNGKNHLVTADEDFVIPTGGGYFFAPSIDALCLLTGNDPERGREAEKTSGY
jgi:Dyp-type peroxidase family